MEIGQIGSMSSDSPAEILLGFLTVAKLRYCTPSERLKA